MLCLKQVHDHFLYAVYNDANIKIFIYCQQFKLVFFQNTVWSFHLILDFVVLMFMCLIVDIPLVSWYVFHM